jgi:prepilin-type processing-associated H-X9-DG protein
MPERDYDDDRPRRRRDDDYDDRPRRRRDDEDDEDDRPRRPQKKGSSTGLIIGIVVGLLLLCGVGGVVLMFPAVSKVRSAAARAKDSNNLKQIGLGAHSLNDSTMVLTEGPYHRDSATGRVNTNLSYRVALLPYIEQDPLYRQFRTDEGWDSLSNRRLADTRVATFQSPIDPPETTTTRYRGFEGTGTMFEPGTKVTISRVMDGTSNTILFVTADDGVVWSKPDELRYTPGGPLPTIGKKAFPGGTNVLMADGSVRFLKADTPEPVLRGLITRNGAEPIPLDW